MAGSEESVTVSSAFPSFFFYYLASVFLSARPLPPFVLNGFFTIFIFFLYSLHSLSFPFAPLRFLHFVETSGVPLREREQKRGPFPAESLGNTTPAEDRKLCAGSSTAIRSIRKPWQCRTDRDGEYPSGVKPVMHSETDRENHASFPIDYSPWKLRCKSPRPLPQPRPPLSELLAAFDFYARYRIVGFSFLRNSPRGYSSAADQCSLVDLGDALPRLALEILGADLSRRRYSETERKIFVFSRRNPGAERKTNKCARACVYGER